jgi:predicted transposase YbfD/YdcC
VQASTTATSQEPLAFDGKARRAARSGQQRAPHLLAFCTHHSQETFFQIRVDEKTNEIPIVKQVLPTLPIRERVCTADALHTHAELLRLMQALGAETVLTVKGNQPTLYADLETYFADQQALCWLHGTSVHRKRQIL